MFLVVASQTSLLFLCKKVRQPSRWRRIISYFAEGGSSDLPEPFPLIEIGNYDVVPKKAQR
jgi:hypothetical protein